MQRGQTGEWPQVLVLLSLEGGPNSSSTGVPNPGAPAHGFPQRPVYSEPEPREQNVYQCELL